MIKPDGQILVIFGASGDLTKRKLLPSLYELFARDMLHDARMVNRLLRALVARRLIHHQKRFFPIRPRFALDRKVQRLDIHVRVGIINDFAFNSNLSERDQTSAFVSRSEPLRKKNLFQTHQISRSKSITSGA